MKSYAVGLKTVGPSAGRWVRNVVVFVTSALPIAAGASDNDSGPSQARSLADAPSLMEKARARAQTQAPARRFKPPNERTAAGLLRRAARLTGRELPDGIRPPDLVALPLKQLRQRVCPANPGDCRSLVAAYGIKDGVIVHSDKINMADPLDRSYLLHELVHYLQHMDEGEQVTRNCESILQRERHAYIAQSRYLANLGQSFPIDEMMKLTYCPS